MKHLGKKYPFLAISLFCSLLAGPVGQARTRSDDHQSIYISYTDETGGDFTVSVNSKGNLQALPESGQPLAAMYVEPGEEPVDSCAKSMPWGVKAKVIRRHERPDPYWEVKFDGYCDRYLFVCSKEGIDYRKLLFILTKDPLAPTGKIHYLHLRDQKPEDLIAGSVIWGPFDCEEVAQATAVTVVGLDDEDAERGAHWVGEAMLEKGPPDPGTRVAVMDQAREQYKADQAVIRIAKSNASLLCQRLEECKLSPLDQCNFKVLQGLFDNKTYRTLATTTFIPEEACPDALRKINCAELADTGQDYAQLIVEKCAKAKPEKGRARPLFYRNAKVPS